MTTVRTHQSDRIVRPKPDPRSVDEFDLIIGRRIREARKAARYSQADLAKTLDVSHQQVQKYEAGIDRVSVARLLDVCETLNIDAAAFLAGLQELRRG